MTTCSPHFHFGLVVSLHHLRWEVLQAEGGLQGGAHRVQVRAQGGRLRRRSTRERIWNHSSRPTGDIPPFLPGHTDHNLALVSTQRRRLLVHVGSAHDDEQFIQSFLIFTNDVNVWMCLFLFLAPGLIQLRAAGLVERWCWGADLRQSTLKTIVWRLCASVSHYDVWVTLTGPWLVTWISSCTINTFHTGPDHQELLERKHLVSITVCDIILNNNISRWLHHRQGHVWSLLRRWIILLSVVFSEPGPANVSLLASLAGRDETFGGKNALRLPTRMWR